MRASEVSATPGDYFAQGRVLGPFATLLRTVNALIARTGGASFKAFGPLPICTVSSLPDAAAYEGCLIFVSNETGGATVAFSDGAGNWRRVQDRAIVS